MSKNIIICCDGTGNDFGDENSNVVLLFAALEKNTSKQIVYYDPGVGTPSTYDAFNPITKRLKYVLGQAFGYGLKENIMSAYQFLMQNYEEGDQLYFFGFSRGAYTIRALAGFIHVCGLLHANGENLIPEAMRIYHDRNLRPIAKEFKKTFSRHCPIHFLGLWDTVSSVGWIYDPVVLQSTKNNSSVQNVRHAISIDERRAFFRQNLWGNKYKDQQDIKQVWFPGVHSDVGGSYPPERSQLSQIALEWMMVEAKEKGLLFLESEVNRIREILKATPKPYLADLNKSLTGFWHLGEYWLKFVKVKKTKAGGQTKWVSKPYFNRYKYRYLSKDNRYTLHESVFLRLKERADYRPENLMNIGDGIAAIEQHFDMEKWVRL